MRKYAAELIATFILVFAGAGAVIADAYISQIRLAPSFGVVGIALAHGLALALGIAAIGHISGGHVNPAITVAFWITRRIPLRDAAGYIVAQLAGGAGAALTLKALLPGDAFDFAGGGITALGEGVGFREGLFIELVLTFFLAFVIWGVAVHRRGRSSIAPLAIGLVLTFDILAGGAFTGGAMNPARWFGPALVVGEWSNALVWTLGPLFGALIGGLAYEVLFLGEQGPAEEEEMEEELEEELGAEEEEFAPESARTPPYRGEPGAAAEPRRDYERPPADSTITPPRTTPSPPGSPITPPRETTRPWGERPPEEKTED